MKHSAGDVFSKYLSIFTLFLYMDPLLASGGISDVSFSLSAVSPDGALAFGADVDSNAMYWLESGDPIDLPDGSSGTVMGAATNGTLFGTGDGNSVYWLFADDTYTPYTISAAGAYNYPHGISHNGQYIVGSDFDSDDDYSEIWNQGFLFTIEGANYLLLGMNDPYGAASSDAMTVSDDGTIVGGDDYSYGWDGAFPVYWTIADNNPTENILYGATGSQDNGVVQGMDATGLVMVGQSNSLPARWTTSTPGSDYSDADVTTLSFSGATSGQANAVSADGSVIVGQCDGTPENETSGTYAFRWSESTGLQSIEQWLASTGAPVDLGEGVTTNSAVSVSDNGNAIVGSLSNSDSFLAIAGGGLVTLGDLTTSLSSVSILAASVIENTDLMMHGAHGHPTRNLVEVGKYCSWITGDAGSNTHGAQDGSTFVTDVGLCKRINETTQVSMALGYDHYGSDTVYSGNYATDGNYVMLEASVRMPQTEAPLWVTVSLPFEHATVDTHRGYMNPSNLDASYGSTAVNTYGMRVRLELLDYLRLDILDAKTKLKTVFTPYIDFSYAHASIDGYTETGGSFPTVWNALSESSGVIRFGADSVTQWRSVGLLGTVEFAHRMQDAAADYSGQVIGVDPFSLSGQPLAKNWVRIGGGMERKLGSGTASFSLNMTTHSEAPTYWGAASYRVEF